MIIAISFSSKATTIYNYTISQFDVVWAQPTLIYQKSIKKLYMKTFSLKSLFVYLCYNSYIQASNNLFLATSDQLLDNSTNIKKSTFE